ncbi:MAG: amidohydrolase [bacterium]
MSITEIGRATERETAELVRLRRDFHRHPELGYQEVRTSGIVATRMRELGYEVRDGVAKTGVIASRGAGGRTLYVRADMDALPIVEENDVDYRSAHDGVMHACGHDAHTAIAMMVAERFAKADLAGRISFGFQPAEEGGQGADRMAEQGGLDGVDAALGLHVWSSLPVGKIGVTTGPAMASVDEFVIEVRGFGGHAAVPHLADDPIVKAAQLVTDLQTIVSRRVSPLDAAVVTVTRFDGGSAFNVIPDSVTLWGTIRTFNERVREDTHRLLQEITGERGTVSIRRVTRVLVNDARMCEIVREAAASVVGAENVIDSERTMGGEDFATVLATVPGCFFFVGSALPQGTFPHHHPRFDVDERALPLGLDVMTRAAHLYLERGFRDGAGAA